MSNKNTVESQGDIRVIKGESASSIIKESFLHHLLVVSVFISIPVVLLSMANVTEPDLFIVSIFVPAVIGFVLWVFRARVISKVNFDYVIDMGQGTFEFPADGLNRGSIALESIENVYLNTNKSESLNGKKITNYDLNVTGSFGAMHLRPASKLARDELRGALREAIKKQKNKG